MLGMSNDINMLQDYATLINEKLAIYLEQITKQNMQLRIVSAMGRQVRRQVNSLPNRNVP